MKGDQSGVSWAVWCCRIVVVTAVIVAYGDCYSGAFQFDDVPGICENEGIRDLGTTLRGLYRQYRPVTELTFALNYAAGGLNVWGYHAVNVGIHVAAALSLFGLVRVTLAGPRCRVWAGRLGLWVAVAVAVAWGVHPLNTQAVTYVIQRAQALAGLFTLLTLYCLARGVTGGRWSWVWNTAAAVCCALAVGSKQDAVVTPVLAVLYDRTFLSGSWRAVARRWPLHLSMFATWLLLGLSLRFAVTGMTETAVVPAGLTAAEVNPPEVAPTAGFASGRGPWWRYALTQCGVHWHYLRLVVWPHPLCLDYYDWPLATGWELTLPAVGVLGLFALTAWTAIRRPALGFPAVVFFLALAPTSSVMPIDDLVAEHRMYLPLAGVITLAASGAVELARRLCGPTSGATGVVAVAALSMGLAYLTWLRNADYADPIAFGTAEVAARPQNGRAHHNLAVALARAGRPADGEFEAAERYKPSRYTYTLHAQALLKQGRPADALVKYRDAVAQPELPADPRVAAEDRLPEFALRFNIAKLLADAGRWEEAAAEYEKAVRLKPDALELRLSRSRSLVQLGRWAEAEVECRTAVALAPDSVQANNNLAMVLARTGSVDEAGVLFARAAASGPNNPVVYGNWGAMLVRNGRAAEAVAVFRRGVECRPARAGELYGLAHALRIAGDVGESDEVYEQAVKADPGGPTRMAAQARSLATHPRAELREPVEAVRLAEMAVQATGERQADPLDALAVAYAAAGRFSEAVGCGERAAVLCGGQAEQAAAIRARVDGYRKWQANVPPSGCPPKAGEK